MPASESKKLSGVFISYRRSDNPDAVGRIYDRLVSEFGKARVFKDVDSIPLGQDFRGHLNDIVGGCAAVLAIIGPRWTDARNSAGQRRLEDPDDFVRIELEAALARDIPVVPVLVGHAPMPGTADLPASLASMVYRQSIEVRPDPDFHNDATRLVAALRAIIDPNAPREQAPPVPVHAQPSILKWMWPAAFVVAALAGIALAVPALRYLQLTVPSETRTEINTPTQAGTAGTMALSPDGRQIAFVVTAGSVSRLWLRPLSATAAHPMPGTEGANLPFWSPDSKSIGFFTNSALKRIEVGGGAPQTLATVRLGIGGTWNTDGVILFGQGTGRPLARVAATGGVPVEVTQLAEQAVLHIFPVFLPGGRRFVFAAQGGQAPGAYLGSLDGDTPVKLVSNALELAYLPSGWLLFCEPLQGALIAQRLDADKAALVGSPITLAEGRGVVSASATAIAFWPRPLEGNARRLVWRSRAGDELGEIGEPNATYFSPRLSLDGRVAVTRGDSNNQDVWLLDGSRASRATFDVAGSNFPLWSPDGSQIAFTAGRNGAPDLYLKAADGSGEEKLLLEVNAPNAASSWSSDGRHLLYVTVSSTTGFDVMVLPMTGDRKPWAFLESRFGEGGGEFSPDGKWVAYESDESGRREVYVRPFIVPGEGESSAARGGKWQVSVEGGTYPKWGPDAKEVYFLNPQGEMMAAPLAFSGSALKPGVPVKLFDARILGGGTDPQQGPQYDVARDGRFLINTVPEAKEVGASPITLIQNWKPDAGK